MGKVEDKIKAEIMQQVFLDTLKIYEFLENRFDLDEETKDKLISKLHEINSSLEDILSSRNLL